MDAVNKPAHYQIGGVETIDVIRAKLGPGFGYYFEGNAIKYLTRWRSKGGVEDLRKASVYLGWLIEFEEANPSVPAWMAQAAQIVHDAIAPDLPPAVAELIERSDEEAPTSHLKAGEATEPFAAWSGAGMRNSP